MRPTRVVFVLVPRLHLLDLAGPAQVFSTAKDFGYGYEVSYVAESDEVTTAQGVPLRTQSVWPELDPGDLIVVPGWRSPRLSPEPPIGPEFRQRLWTHHARGGTVASDDDVVTPPESARLDGATDLTVQSLCPGRQVSHGELPTDAVVTQVVERAIGVAPYAPFHPTC